jgi:hypothetical protein
MTFLYPWEDIDLLKALTCMNKCGNTLLRAEKIDKMCQNESIVSSFDAAISQAIGISLGGPAQ